VTWSGKSGGATTASAGIDGNLGSFCTVSNFVGVTSWWMMDLGSVMSIASVVVWGRYDCCSDQSGGLMVSVGNSSDTAAANPLCADIGGGFYADPTQGTQVCTGGATGRYITLFRNNNGPFSFCEFKVYRSMATLRSLVGANANWSPGSGSGSGGNGYGSATALAGIDGNVGFRCIGNSGNGTDNFLSVSSTSSVAWWMLDLGSAVPIAYVVVWGRDDCCYSQSSALTVTVGNSNDAAATNPLCADTAGGFYAATTGTEVCTSGAEGRYITLSKVGGGAFSFCEVQVYQYV
jgi:hypothetical protein